MTATRAATKKKNLTLRLSSDSLYILQKVAQARHTTQTAVIESVLEDLAREQAQAREIAYLDAHRDDAPDPELGAWVDAQPAMFAELGFDFGAEPASSPVEKAGSVPVDA